MALGDKKEDSFEIPVLYKAAGILIVILISGILLVSILNDDSSKAKDITKNITKDAAKDITDDGNESSKNNEAAHSNTNNIDEIPGEPSQKNETGNEKAGDDAIEDAAENEPGEDPEIITIENFYSGIIPELIGNLQNYNESIFDIYDITQDESEIQNLINIVNDECRDNETHELHISCAIIYVVKNSKNSEVCDFSCLPSFCEIYKMHSAVYVLNQVLPEKQIFIAMDSRGRMYVLYREDEKWKTYGINPESVDLNKTIVLYNDEYSTENKFDLIEPRYVKRGGEFCFEIYANDSCTCKIEQQELNVGKCPQLSTEMFMSLCEKQIETFPFLPGKNEFCFEIPHDYEKGLYTYSFTFVSDKNYLGVGNSIIEVSRHNCCIEGTELRGFVVVR